jgi:hypothetical protein
VAGPKIAGKVLGKAFSWAKGTFFESAASTLEKTGSGLNDDLYHRAVSWVVNDPAAKRFVIKGGDGVERELYQLSDGLNGKPGVFEWIIDRSGTSPVITHQWFIPGGKVTGVPH